ncbi:MAG: alpha/beta fold hydrolase [Gemmatimonadales bacterium]
MIVVHGLGRSALSMAVLTGRLRSAGFRATAFQYPSRRASIATLTERLAARVARSCAGRDSSVHFVTHSLGGILVWNYLAGTSGPHRGRVVMLSPPARGSELADAFTDVPLLRSVLGPALTELGTDPDSLVRRLPAADFELGVITGDRSLNPLSDHLIPGPHDGKVSVERARVPGATDFLVVPASHTFIMNRGDVAGQVVAFLRHGRFDTTSYGPTYPDV